MKLQTVIQLWKTFVSFFKKFCCRNFSQSTVWCWMRHIHLEEDVAVHLELNKDLPLMKHIYHNYESSGGGDERVPY